jgi:hypothetical protein
MSEQATHSFITELASSFRRIKGAVEDGKEQTVWHQGRAGAEMLSWENNDGFITHQELCFYGQMVIYRHEEPLQTATVPASIETTHAGVAKADVVDKDPEPSARTLTHAAQLLESIEPDDAYTKNLLDAVRHTLPS